jgi:hypothetical protein
VAGNNANSPSGRRYFEVQMERQNRVIDRLERKVSSIPHLKAKISRLETKTKEDALEKKQLRGMLSTVIALLSGSDFAKARDLSDRLREQVMRLLDKDVDLSAEKESANSTTVSLSDSPSGDDDTG